MHKKIASFRKINAFTIIELLVVIGIISILAVALLVSLNPAEAQKRARDAQRLKDINTMQAIIEQYLNDGNTPAVCTTSCHSDTVTGTSPNVCAAGNWTGISFCTWAKTFPTDPGNGSTRTCVTGTGTTANNCLMRYRLTFLGSNYEIDGMLESTTNQGKAVNDGGTVNSLVQIFSSGELSTATSGYTVNGSN